MANNEVGHFKNYFYADQQGNLHLNGSTFYLDELGGGNTFTNTGMTFPGNGAFTGAQFSTSANNVVLGGFQNGITANGATQANGTVLVAETSVVNVIASGNNAVTLPAPTKLNQQMSIIAANSTNLLVFPDSGTAGCATGGSINGGSANASVTLVGNKGATYVCTGLAPSAWWSLSN